MAEAFGVTTIEMILKHEAHRTGTMSDEARKEGKPTLVLELVPWRMIDPAAVEVEAQDTIQVIDGRLSRTELNTTSSLYAPAADPVFDTHQAPVYNLPEHPFSQGGRYCSNSGE